MEQRQIMDLFRRAGLRPTQQRIAVFDYLLRHPIHPSAETVYQAILQEYPSFSRTTVYNSLHALVEIGLVRELSMGEDEKRYDADLSAHGHFLCRRCGKASDIPLDAAVLAAMRPDGYAVLTQEVQFTGYCPACRKLVSRQEKS